MIQVTVQPDKETTNKMFFKIQPLIDFRTAIRNATERLLDEVKRLAPKATGDYLRSISSTVREYDSPYRMHGIVYSSHQAAEVIEFGADPHTVPIRAITRWMQAVGMRISKNLTIEDVAYRIQKKIEERGLRPHNVFTSAYDNAESYFHYTIDPIMNTIGGSAEYTVILRSTGLRSLPWE